jgi:rhomboid protease GluP
MYEPQYTTIKPKLPYITIGIIIANIVVFLFENISYGNYVYLVSNFGLVPNDIVTGQNLYTLITSMFLHASLYDSFGIFHIFFNMYILFLFGSRVEKSFNPIIYLIFYFVSGIIAGLFHAFVVSYIISMFDASAAFIPTIGASGAVFGVLAAFAVFYPKEKLYIFFFGPISAWILIIGFVAIEVLLAIFPISGFGLIANTAHIGGFIGGLFFSLAYSVAKKRIKFKRKRKKEEVTVIYL